ncbi:MAG: hypothetical protein K2P99_05655 [Burkholderiales bacterium]|nr:hypothetical protein [Burkholderiales bacterium]
MLYLKFKYKIQIICLGILSLLFTSSSNAYSYGHEFDYGLCIDDQTNNSGGGVAESLTYEFKHIMVSCMREPNAKNPVIYDLVYPKGESGIFCSPLKFHLHLDNLTGWCHSTQNITSIAIRGVTNPNVSSTSQIRWHDKPASDADDIAELLEFNSTTNKWGLCGAPANCYAESRYINDRVPFWIVYTIPLGG